MFHEYPQLEWRKYFAEMEAGGNEKNVSWNRSGIDETNVADMEAGMIKICCWNGSGSDERTVSWNGSGIDEINVA